MFVEYEDAAETARVFKLLDGYQLDKNHTFSVSSFGDIFTYANVPSEWSAPQKETYKERENLRSWLVDTAGRDQFVTRVGDETVISWNTKEEPEPSYRRPVSFDCFSFLFSFFFSSVRSSCIEEKKKSHSFIHFIHFIYYYYYYYF